MNPADLPALRAIMESIAKKGYVFIDSYRPEVGIAAVAHEFGRPMTPWSGGLVQDLVPRAGSTPNTYSGIYGLGRFPLHTDLAHWRAPPRYLLLRCVKGYADVPTMLLDGEAIFKDLPANMLSRAIFKPRRPRNGSIPLLRLYEPKEEGYCLRWDEEFIEPASKIGAVAEAGFKAQLGKLPPKPIALARAGDMLLIDNWRVLHARSPIPADRADRKIQRIYLGELH